MRILIFCAILLGVRLFAQTPLAISEGEKQRLALDRERLDLDRERLRSENARGVWTEVVSGIPFLIGLGTVIYGVWSVKRTVQAQTVTKLAELALEGHVPDAVVGRAKLLSGLFKDTLPPDFETTLEEFQASRLKTNTAPPEFITIRTGFVRLLAEFPNQREQILHDLLVYFPGDKELVTELASYPPTANRATNTRPAQNT